MYIGKGIKPLNEDLKNLGLISEDEHGLPSDPKAREEIMRLQTDIDKFSDAARTESRMGSESMARQYQAKAHSAQLRINDIIQYGLKEPEKPVKPKGTPGRKPDPNKKFNARHGGAFDRGKADAYYGRGREPHYYKGKTGFTKKVGSEQMSKEAIRAYHSGYERQKESGEKKDWGNDE